MHTSLCLNVRVADLRISVFVFQMVYICVSNRTIMELSWTESVADIPQLVGNSEVHLKGNKRVGCSAFFLLFS